MNIYTKQIAELLKLSLEDAIKVQNQMMCNDVDFSECSNAKFKREAKQAASEIGLAS